MEPGEEMDQSQQTPVNGKHYEWQLSHGPQWLPIDNDHVIETHYCQPGAKGITIHMCHKQVHIDFDKLETQTAGLGVQRLSLLPLGQTEDVGWYFRDDQLWREYGSTSSGTSSSSVGSGDVERQFALNPRGTFSFTVGSTGYTLDFSTMTQTNCVTGLRRNVRRRPKFTSNTGSVHASSVSSSQLTDGGYKWEFIYVLLTALPSRDTSSRIHKASCTSGSRDTRTCWTFQKCVKSTTNSGRKEQRGGLPTTGVNGTAVRAQGHDGNFKITVEFGKIIPKEAASPVRTSSSSTGRTHQAP